MSNSTEPLKIIYNGKTYITTVEVAQRLGRSRRWVRELTLNGKLPSTRIKIGKTVWNLFPIPEVDEAIQSLKSKKI